ncbi:MAG: DUF6054 family protein [Lachnospiraceae bacterium]|nr:DUF6054 family protein [Lachnospiraceae bacterium]
MAKYEHRFTANFDDFLNRLHEEILRGSITASYQEGSDYVGDGVRCAVRVYERYSVIGSNRLSANVTLVGNGERLFLSIIASGGSQAMFFKMNTWGEENFLKEIVQIVESYEKSSKKKSDGKLV